MHTSVIKKHYSHNKIHLQKPLITYREKPFAIWLHVSRGPADQSWDILWHCQAKDEAGIANKVIDVLSSVLKMAVRFAFVLKQPINWGKWGKMQIGGLVSKPAVLQRRRGVKWLDMSKNSRKASLLSVQDISTRENKITAKRSISRMSGRLRGILHQ